MRRSDRAKLEPQHILGTVSQWRAEPESVTRSWIGTSRLLGGRLNSASTVCKKSREIFTQGHVRFDGPHHRPAEPPRRPCARRQLLALGSIRSSTCSQASRQKVPRPSWRGVCGFNWSGDQCGSRDRPEILRRRCHAGAARPLQGFATLRGTARITCRSFPTARPPLPKGITSQAMAGLEPAFNQVSVNDPELNRRSLNQ